MRRCLFVLLAFAVAGCASWRELPVSLPAPTPLSMPDLRAGRRDTLELCQRQRYDEAKPRLAYLLASDPALADYYLYHLGVAQARTGESRAAIASFSQLSREHPQSVWRPATALELGKLARAAGRGGDAEAYFVLAASATWDRKTRATAQLERARLMLERDQAAQAADLLLDLRRTARGEAAAKEARTLLQTIRAAHPELAPVGAAWLDEAHLLLDEGDPVAAEKAIRSADPAGTSPEAQFLLADALKAQGAPAAATTVLGRIVYDYPSDPVAPRALMRMATLFWNRDEDIAAEAAFQEYLRRYSGEPAAPDALYSIARIKQSAGEIPEALDTFATLARRYPEATVTWDGRWRISWIHYRNGRFAEAAAGFAALARDTPGPDAAAARYWQARALESGHPAEARALYAHLLRDAPGSYYALQAERQLGLRASALTASGARVAPPAVPVPAPPATLDAYHVTRYAELRAAELPRLARGELGAIERDDQEAATRQFLALAYFDLDDYRAARRVANAAGSDASLPASLREQLSYPLGYWSIVRTEAERQQIDPLLVVALIRQESQFDAAARSPANARGLMQLLPSTARREAQGLGWGDDPEPRLDDPTVNVTLGTRHLRVLLDRWGGDAVKALAAYNGGGDAVEKWQSRYGDLDDDEFVESITYRETRDYVKRVLANYRTYERLYAAGGSNRLASTP